MTQEKNHDHNNMENHEHSNMDNHGHSFINWNT